MKNYLLNNVFEIPEFKFDIKKLKHTYLNNKNIWATYGKGEKDTILPRKNSLHTKYVDKEDVIEHISQIKDYENIIDNIKFLFLLAMILSLLEKLFGAFTFFALYSFKKNIPIFKLEID